MKIWVIGRSYPTAKNNMSGSFELEQAQMLARRGHDVTYIACVFHPFKKIKKWGFANWQDGDLRVFVYSQFYFPGRFQIHWDRFRTRRWEQLLSKVETATGIPDVIHLHYPALVSVPQAILPYKDRGARIIATEHWTAVLTQSITKHDQKQLKTYVESADRFICVGRPLKESVIRLTNTKKDISVVPNIVSGFFKISEDRHEGFRFIAAGRLVPVKQFDRIIYAFRQAFADDAGVTLTIVGGGEMMGELRAIVSKLGLDDRVTLTGVLSREQTASKMSEADALVCYSRLETFGVPVIEAWNCGIPAIATDAIGFAEYWKDDLGELISYDDDQRLSQAMRKIVSERDRYSKEKIASFARDHFSEEAVYGMLMALYSD